MKIELISWTKDPISTVAKAASMCYDSKPSINIVKHCINSGHTSILEHANFTFKIEGVSRSLLAQLTRHRHASYSVRSQRYCKEDEAKMIVPEAILSKDNYIIDVITDFNNYMFNTYDFLLEKGLKTEDARCVLPNMCETKLIMTFNLRSLGNFMNERLCTRAQKEIRDFAKEIVKVLLSCQDFNEDDLEILKIILVPKCEKYSLHFCSEEKGCGKHKTLKEIKTIVGD